MKGGHGSTNKQVGLFNEEVTQLEVSIGQLSLFHDNVSIHEGLPSKDFNVSGSWGQMFNESITLFEHALNSGLVMEDDIQEYAYNNQIIKVCLNYNFPG